MDPEKKYGVSSKILRLEGQMKLDRKSVSKFVIIAGLICIIIGLIRYSSFTLWNFSLFIGFLIIILSFIIISIDRIIQYYIRLKAVKSMKRVQNRVGFLLNEIREETSDRITIVEHVSVWRKISVILMGIFILLFQIPFLEDSWSFPFIIIPIFFLVASAYIIFWVIRMLLVSYSVTVNKKSHRIIIKKDSNINLLKSIKEIPFLDIERIETKRHVNDEDGDTWSVNLLKFQGGSTEIYVTYYKSDAELLAEKLSKIINRELTHK